MSAAIKTTIIRSIPPRFIASYFWTKESLFRFYQNRFLAQYGKNISGEVIELGGEKSYEHVRFFPKAKSFCCTNVAREYDDYLDILNMPFENNSKDVYVCASVLEHIFNIDRAFQEITRTLKIGGVLLLVVPFAYPFHDEVDYWRIAKSAYSEILKDYDIEVVHFGGVFTSTASALQRPRGKIGARYFFRKVIGFAALLMGIFFETADGFPIAYGIYAVKK